MRRMIALGLLVTAGCAAQPILGALGLTRMSVTVPTELPFADEITLQLGGPAGEAAKLGNSILGALGQESLEKKLGKALKEAATPLRQLAAQGFKSELEKAHVFNSIVNTGGDLGMTIGVSRWGLAYDATTKNYVPVLDLQASLSQPLVGVVWKGERSAAQLGAGVKDKIGRIDITALIAKPQSYQDIMGLVAMDLSRQLVEDLKAHPPQLN